MVSQTVGLISGISTTAGTYNVTATVSDGVLDASRSFVWTVVAGNVAPTLAAPGNQSSTAGQAVVLQLQGADANGDPLTYAATGLPAGVQLTAGTGRIAGTPTSAGTSTVTVTVGDGVLSASRSFVWTVVAGNAAPTLAAPGNQSSTAGQAVVLQLQGADANGDSLTYTATGLPAGVQLTAGTGRIAGTPTSAGTSTVTVTVGDGVLSASRSFVWTVVVGNAAPTLAAPGNQSSTAGQAVVLQLQGADANGDALTYTATGLPAGVQLTAGTGRIAGTPTSAGTSNVTVTVGDGVLSASRSFTWTIAAANVAPTLAAPGNQSSTAGQAVVLQLQGADANGDSLTYTATGLPPGVQLTAGTGRIAGTPTVAGTFLVTVTASDGTLPTSRAFVWTVVGAIEAPGAAPATGTLEPGTSTRAAARHASTTALYTGTAAVVRSVASDDQSPGNAGRVFTGTGALLRTPESTAPAAGGTPVAYTGTAALQRSVAQPAFVFDSTSSGTGTGAVAKVTQDDMSLTGSLSSLGSSLTRYLGRDAVVSGTQAAMVQPDGEDQDGSAADAGAMSRRRAAGGVTAAPSAPAVSIQTPVDAATLDGTRSVIFSGVAYDVEDGDLSRHIVWWSSKDGRLGTGALFHTTLSAGTHIVTAAVTNSQGDTRRAQVTIVVAQ
jgi:hypothetical protein